MPRPNRVTAVAYLVLTALAVAGCDILDDVVRGPDAPRYARHEVWNATTEPLFLIDREGRRLDVPACGHAVAEQLEVHRIEVRTEAGYILGFGSGDSETQYVVLVARSSEIVHSQVPPVAIPPCQGRPEVQVGS